MDTRAATQEQMLPADTDRLVLERVDAYLRAKEEEKAHRTSRLAIIASKATLDWAYPTLLLATTAAAWGWDVGILYTFYGLNIIHKQNNKRLQVAPLGDSLMPMSLPNGRGAIGMTEMFNQVLQSAVQSHPVSSLDELLALAADAGVKLWPCGMMMRVFGFKQEDFIEGAQPVRTSIQWLEYARDADINLFI